MNFIGGSAFPAPSLWDYLFKRDASASTAQYSIPDQVESMLASMGFCQQVEEIVPGFVPIEGRANSGKIMVDSSVNADFVSLSPTHSHNAKLNTEVGSDFISLGSLSTDTNKEKHGNLGYISLASSDSRTKPPVPPDHSRRSASAALPPAIHEEEHNYFYVVSGPLVDIVTMQRPKSPALKSAPESNPCDPSCFSAFSHATAIDHCNTVALHSRFYPREKLKLKDPTDLTITGSGSATSSLLSTANKNQKQTTKRRKCPENHARNVNHLWLTVDEDTYQQLGLIGRRSNLSRKSGGPGRPKKKSKKLKSQRCAAFYIIDVDLNTTRVASASAPRRQAIGADTASRASSSSKNTPRSPKDKSSHSVSKTQISKSSQDKASHSVSKTQTSGSPKDTPSTISDPTTARSSRPPPHSKLWSRLQWALKDRVPSTTLLVVASKSGRSLPICFPTSCQSQRLRVSRTSWISPSPIPVPTCAPGSKTGKATLDVDEAQLTLQWFGAICCRCLQLLQPDRSDRDTKGGSRRRFRSAGSTSSSTAKYLSTYGVANQFNFPSVRSPLTQAAEVFSVTSTRYEGFMSTDFARHRLLQLMKRLQDQPHTPWVAMVIHGFADAPFSWRPDHSRRHKAKASGRASQGQQPVQGREHGFAFSGENQLVVVVLRNGCVRVLGVIGPADAPS